MMNEKLIEGLNMIIEGATAVRDELLSSCNGEAKAEAGEKKTTSKSVARREKVQKEEAMNAPADEPAESGEVIGEVGFSREQLDAMKYNDLKKLGASLGVPCTGKRNEITDRILACKGTVTTATADEEPGEEAPADDDGKVVPINKGKKGGLKKKAKEPEIPEEFIEQANEIAEEMTVEEIVEALADAGIEAKGKKSEVVMSLAKALAEGLIELDGDEDEEETAGEDTSADESTEVEGEDEAEEITEDSYFEEFDPDGVNDPENMTEERANAVKAMMKEAIEGVEEETLTEEDMSTFCETFCTQDEIDSLGEEYTFEELFALYCETKKRLIDNDGELHEAEDPYEIGEDNFCCGHELKYDKKKKVYICETCGGNYEAE